MINWHAYTYISKNPAENTVAAVAILNVCILAGRSLGFAKIPSSWIARDRFLGDLTYPLYLNHYVVSIVVLNLAPPRAYGIGLYVGNYLLSVLFAYLAMQLSEPLTRRLRERIRGHKL